MTCGEWARFQLDLLPAGQVACGAVWMPPCHCPRAPNCEGGPSVLVSAGTELIFFLVAGTVLCFGFSVRIMLITL